MIEFTRRTAIEAAVTSTAVAAVATPAAAAASTSAVATRERGLRQTSRRSLYRRRRFQSRKGARFVAVGHGRHLRLQLVRVNSLSAQTKGSERTFALTFRARRPGPSSGTFLVKRGGFQATTLFLVATDASCRTYRATVNNG